MDSDACRVVTTSHAEPISVGTLFGSQIGLRIGTASAPLCEMQILSMLGLLVHPSSTPRAEKFPVGGPPLGPCWRFFARPCASLALERPPTPSSVSRWQLYICEARCPHSWCKRWRSVSQPAFRTPVNSSHSVSSRSPVRFPPTRRSSRRLAPLADSMSRFSSIFGPTLHLIPNKLTAPAMEPQARNSLKMQNLNASEQVSPP